MTTAHPAVDTVTARSAVIIQDRPLVPLSGWLTDVMARCGEIGRATQVLTPHDTRITLPLRLALGGQPTGWVVQEPGAGYYDGFTGLPVDWDGAAFVHAEKAGKRVRSPTFLSEPPPDLGHHLMISLRMVHEATVHVELGGTVERLTAALAGAPPVSWGTAEPALARWPPGQISEFAHRRTPRGTNLVFMGPHGRAAVDTPRFGGTVRVSRVNSGVKETITFAVALPPGSEPPLHTLGDLVNRLAREGRLWTLVAQWAPGRVDLTYPARWCGRPVPVGLAVGPDAVAKIGKERAQAAEVDGALIGHPATPGMWYALRQDDPRAWHHLGDLRRHLQGG